MPLLRQVGVVRMRFGIQANGEVSFAGNDVAAFVEPAADKADIVAMLLFGARGESA